MTLYTEIPTLRDRVVAATLVVLGRVEKLVDSTIDYQSEKPVVRSTFSIFVESVLRGKIDTNSINIQIAGGTIEKIQTPWSVILKEGERVLLFLCPNYALQKPEVFVPYFGSAYIVTDDDNIELSEDVARDFKYEKFNDKIVKIKLAEVYQAVNDVTEQYEKQKSILIENEPRDQLNKSYPPISEMPQAESGGARPSAPEDLA